MNNYKTLKYTLDIETGNTVLFLGPLPNDTKYIAQTFNANEVTINKHSDEYFFLVIVDDENIIPDSVVDNGRQLTFYFSNVVNGILYINFLVPSIELVQIPNS